MATGAARGQHQTTEAPGGVTLNQAEWHIHDD